MASRSILDKPLPKQRSEVCMHAQCVLRCNTCLMQINLSTFAFLFSEMVRYSHDRVQSIPDLETKYH